jgi:hypothetical protein
MDVPINGKYQLIFLKMSAQFPMQRRPYSHYAQYGMPNSSRRREFPKLYGDTASMNLPPRPELKQEKQELEAKTKELKEYEKVISYQQWKIKALEQMLSKQTDLLYDKDEEIELWKKQFEKLAIDATEAENRRQEMYYEDYRGRPSRFR